MANDIRICDKCKHMKVKKHGAKAGEDGTWNRDQGCLQVLLRPLLTIRFHLH